MTNKQQVQDASALLFLHGIIQGRMDARAGLLPGETEELEELITAEPEARISWFNTYQDNLAAWEALLAKENIDPYPLEHSLNTLSRLAYLIEAEERHREWKLDLSDDDLCRIYEEAGEDYDDDRREATRDFQYDCFCAETEAEQNEKLAEIFDVSIEDLPWYLEEEGIDAWHAKYNILAWTEENDARILEEEITADAFHQQFAEVDAARKTLADAGKDRLPRRMAGQDTKPKKESMKMTDHESIFNPSLHRRHGIDVAITRKTEHNQGRGWRA